MKERFVSVAIRQSTGSDSAVPVISEKQNFSLVGAYGDIENSQTEIIAMTIIDRLKLAPSDSKVLYKYHLWQENPQRAFVRIKGLVEETREDEIDQVLNKVNESNYLVDKYDQFYKKYTRATEGQNRKDLSHWISENIPNRGVAQKAEVIINNAVNVKTHLDNKLKESDLLECLKEKELSLQEKRAATAIDLLNISLADKQILFAAGIFFDKGVFRAQELLEFSIDKTVGSRDKVRTNSRYEELWQKVSLLLRPNFVEVAVYQQTMNQREMAKELEISIKAVERIDRALVYYKIIPPTKTGAILVEEQDRFINKVLKLRSRDMGNYQIAEALDVSINKVETAARFLVWLGLVRPISKSDALKTRWNRESFKQRVSKYLETLGSTEKVSIRRIHAQSGIEIGYDMFLSLYHEISKEQTVPPVRKTRR